MKTSRKGVLELAEHEGIVLGPYKDSVGVWTYGVGHTAAAGGLNPAKMAKVDTRGWDDHRMNEAIAEAVDVFSEDLGKYEARVRDAVKAPIKQHQFDALVSFDFNTGGIYKAKLTKAINSGDMSGNQFMGWVKPKEIIKRRTAEMNLFRTGDYEANGNRIAVYDAVGDGRIRYRTSVNSTAFSKVLLAAPDVKEGKKRSKATGIAGILAALTAVGYALRDQLCEWLPFIPFCGG